MGRAPNDLEGGGARENDPVTKTSCKSGGARRLFCTPLHIDLASADGAPFLVLGHRHPAFYADPDARLRRFTLPQ